MSKYFTPEEIKILIQEWPNTLRDDIEKIFNNKYNKTQIDRKAYDIGLKKSTHIRDVIQEKRIKIIIHRNKNILGRDLSKENLHQIALKYNTRKEFKKFDPSAYVSARICGCLEEITSHMKYFDETFSYPQVFLYLLIKDIFNSYDVKFNDRKAIYPKELDVYIPSMKLAFEYNGNAYHNRKSDKEKQIICKNNNITLIKIIEGNKRYPEKRIIKTLTEYSIIKNVNIEKYQKNAFSKQGCYEIEEIKSNCTTFSEFKNENRRLYEKIIKRNLESVYLQDLIDDRPQSKTINEIIEKIGKCKSKKDFYQGFHPYYIAYKKRFRDNKEIKNAYESLAGRISPQPNIIEDGV